LKSEAEMIDVYLLWHQRPLSDDETDDKLLGVYSSEESARRRIRSASSVPGFADYPDAFTIDRYQVDKDEWTEGFVSVS
jgi:hypothetical protein